jgi:hypothetical protein
MTKLFFAVCVLLVLIQYCSALVVVNSLDGRDVVSGVYYAAVTHDNVVFITPSYDETSVYNAIGTGNSVLLIQSSANPVMTGLATGLTNKGDTVTTITSADPLQTNLELAQKSGTKNFVLVDQVYGYNTVSALAYAKLNSMYLIFTDKNDASSVASFLKGNGAAKVLLYGYTDAEVKSALDANGIKYTEINTGDKFDDNLAIDDLYFQQRPSELQAVLSDGNAFESTTATGDDPVILISPIIPTGTANYVQQKVASGQLKVGLLVEAEYAQTAYNLKTSVNSQTGKNLTILVKFGESTGNGGQGVPQVLFFPLPGPSLGLVVEKAEYNTAKKALEVTFNNTGNALEYVRSNILVFSDGTYVQTVGDEQPFSINRGGVVGREYPADITSGNITLNITAYYGSSMKSEENGIQLLMGAGDVNFVDSSLLDIKDFTADQSTGDLLVDYANTGNVTDYFSTSATVDIGGTPTSISDNNVYTLAPGQGKMVRFPGIAKSGSNIVAFAQYGAREAFMGKTVQKAYAPQVTAAATTNTSKGADNSLLYIIGAVVLVLIALAAYYQFVVRKK